MTTTDSDSLSEPPEGTMPGVAQPGRGGRRARHDRLVEDAGLDSFPASDPPSWWAGLEPTPPLRAKEE